MPDEDIYHGAQIKSIVNNNNNRKKDCESVQNIEVLAGKTYMEKMSARNRKTIKQKRIKREKMTHRNFSNKSLCFLHSKEIIKR